MKPRQALPLTVRWWLAAKLVVWAMHIARHDAALVIDLAAALERAGPRAEAVLALTRKNS